LSEAGGTVDEKTFLSVVILDGVGKISCGDDELDYRKGDSFFLTAGAGVWKICGRCHALLTTVPSHE
ncbi:MAG: mannose-6-phosphate isomerase, partial [Selenomonadaceae bacterium]|nr:mannose-6-phosphate isomerase [Selenomonadaceae bacterium]